MAYTIADRDRVEAAIASGTLRVEIDGKSITYRSIDDLIRARDQIVRALELAGTLVAAKRTSYVVFGRGDGCP